MSEEKISAVGIYLFVKKNPIEEILKKLPEWVEWENKLYSSWGKASPTHFLKWIEKEIKNKEKEKEDITVQAIEAFKPFIKQALKEFLTWRERKCKPDAYAITHLYNPSEGRGNLRANIEHYVLWYAVLIIKEKYWLKKR